MKDQLRTGLVVLCLLDGIAAAQQAGWAWEETGEIEQVAGGDAERAAQGSAGTGDFGWSWQEERTPDDGAAVADRNPASQPAQPAQPAQPVPLPPDIAPPAEEEEREAPVAPGGPAGIERPVPAATGGRTVDVSVYGEVLQENLELRRQVEQASKDKQAIRLQNEKLNREVGDLEKRIAEFAGLINQLQSQTSSSTGGVATADAALVERQLAEAQAERTRLKDEVQVLESRLADLTAVTPPEPSVKPGSDLFRQVEAENIRLKKQLSELEAARKQAALVREQEAAAAEKRQAALDRREEAVAGPEPQPTEPRRLAERLPDLERELGALRSTAQQKDVELMARQRDIEAMQVELERREDRIRKAERMADIIEKTRREVSQISDSEKRDMHYNMALVYAKEGRFDDAQKEYLRALRVDPTDADVHYNLAILYDDELGDKRRAAMHYRKYLKLRPNATDVDQVKDWLMRIDMGR